MYRIYDVRDWDGRGGRPYTLRWLEKSVFKASPASDPER